MKVALIAIDRSILAFEESMGHITSNARDSDLPSLLRDLRRMCEKRFPQARSFLRPGLDQHFH